MKKTISFLRSMKFGMILLLCILVLCFAGSMIVQGASANEYLARYGESGAAAIHTLALDHVFTSWYFVLLSLLFCGNLLLCSVQRAKATMHWKKTFVRQAEKKEMQYPLDEKAHAALSEYLAKNHTKKEQHGETELYFRNIAGAWGSFILHISLLLVFIVGAAVLIFAKVEDVSIKPGETYTMQDKTEIYVDSFRMTDDNGSLDYASVISVRTPNGKESGLHEIKVNYPLRVGKYKVYQQNYYTAGCVTVVNEETGAAEDIFLTESCFLSLDGEYGFYFQGMLPGYRKGEDGKPVETEKNDVSNVVYMGTLMTDEGMSSALLFPEDEASAGGITFKFKAPVSYPGLRVKQMSGALMVLLYAVFALLIIGLWLCFFKVPICVKVNKEGFAVISSRIPASFLLNLEVNGIIAGK